jgi:hypothetical protein
LKVSEYEFHDVPEDAVTTASGVHAGHGDDFYVIFAGGGFSVFHRKVLQNDPIPAYHLLKEIPLKPPPI